MIVSKAREQLTLDDCSCLSSLSIQALTHLAEARQLLKIAVHEQRMPENILKEQHIPSHKLNRPLIFLCGVER